MSTPSFGRDRNGDLSAAGRIATRQITLKNDLCTGWIIRLPHLWQDAHRSDEEPLGKRLSDREWTFRRLQDEGHFLNDGIRMVLVEVNTEVVIDVNLVISVAIRCRWASSDGLRGHAEHGYIFFQGN